MAHHQKDRHDYDIWLPDGRLSVEFLSRRPPKIQLASKQYIHALLRYLMEDLYNPDVAWLIAEMATLPEVDDDARIARVPVDQNPVDANNDQPPANNAGEEYARNKKTRRQLFWG